jgi:hypothetical protein
MRARNRILSSWLKDSIKHFDSPCFGVEYHNAMTDIRDTEEYGNFANLLRRVVSVPRAEIQRRMEDEKTAKEWAKENKQRTRRARPIVSPAAVSSSRNRA